MQLHPGDLGWYWQHGPDAVAGALRVWTDDDRIVGIGLFDGPAVLRMTVAPDLRRDRMLAERVVADLSELAAGTAVETPNGTLVQELLTSSSWSQGDSWTPLSRSLDVGVPVPAGLRVVTVGEDEIDDFVEVHRSAWGSARFTTDLWDEMSRGAAFSDARCLLGYDDAGLPVAGVTVWGAGPGRPGLLEPIGVHADHRGHGHGRAICLAAAAALQDMGCSAATVCTESERVGAVATYESAGYRRLPERHDRVRTSSPGTDAEATQS
ncbi:GNAT family N-acetyltransferase [Nakamurella sp. YIM 132087]|uniref:GNAT family N-acetyltransferase n=2 Tax=Nakamurella alba TaxID=2665158 RepID=A0A7K1FPC4_9ACTN|nr:GNAT family N-acetyltransferase [Nakamurella alba]